MRIEKHKLITGIFLFAFWICATVPFILQEVTQEYHGPEVAKLWTLGEVAVAILGLWTLKARVDKVIILTLFTLSFLDTVIFNHISVLMWLNGVRLYFGFIFMLPILRYFWENEGRRRYFVAKMDRLIYLYLVIQFPCMVIQCVRYGAYDNVSGSIGWMASGAASTIIYLSSFYLMMRRWNHNLNYIDNLRNNWVLIMLLIPTWLNETKVSFIYITMYFLLLVPMDRKFIKRLTIVLPVIALVLIGAAMLYKTMVGDQNQTESYELADYLLGNDILLDVVEYAVENDVVEVNESDYARGLKFYLLPKIYDQYPGSWFTGFGLGQFKGGNGMEQTEFAKRYFWLLQGTIMQWHMALLEMGIPGGLLYIIFWITAFRLWGKHKKSRNLNMSWMFGITTAIFSIYIPPFFIPPFYMQFMFMVFVCSRWNELPPYRHIPLLGTKQIIFSRHD